jgi:hypothetical protein
LAIVEVRDRASAPLFARAAMFTFTASARITRCLLSAVRAPAGALRSRWIGLHRAAVVARVPRSRRMHGLRWQETGLRSDRILIGASPSWMASREGG